MSLDFFFFSSRRRHTRCSRDWSSDVCSSDLIAPATAQTAARQHTRCKHLAPTDLNRLAGRANRNLAAILCLTLRLRPLLPQRCCLLFVVFPVCVTVRCLCSLAP